MLYVMTLLFMTPNGICFSWPSITVKASHLFLVHLISNNWNVSPPRLNSSDAQFLKINPLCLPLLSVLKHYSSQTFVSLTTVGILLVA